MKNEEGERARWRRRLSRERRIRIKDKIGKVGCEEEDGAEVEERKRVIVVEVNGGKTREKCEFRGGAIERRAREEEEKKKKAIKKLKGREATKHCIT